MEYTSMDAINVVAKRFMRGEIMRRSSPTRDAQRDEIMRMIYSKPGFSRVLAKHLGVTPSSMSAWNRVPARFVLDIAPLIEMTPEQIRPDVFSRTRRRRT
jgi:hypothetical protein